MSPVSARSIHSPDPNFHLQKTDRSGRGLSLEFCQNDDRSGHLIRLLQPAGSVILLKSQEAGAGHWPQSPPLQQVTKEQHNSKEVILAVGMSHQSHWSAAFQVAANNIRIDADVACRLNDERTTLSSTYSLVASCAPRLSEDGRDVSLDPFGVNLRCSPPARLVLDFSRNEILIQLPCDSQKTAAVNPSLPARQSRTWEWSYSIELYRG